MSAWEGGTHPAARSDMTMSAPTNSKTTGTTAGTVQLTRQPRDQPQTKQLPVRTQAGTHCLCAYMIHSAHTAATKNRQGA